MPATGRLAGRGILFAVAIFACLSSGCAFGMPNQSGILKPYSPLGYVSHFAEPTSEIPPPRPAIRPPATPEPTKVVASTATVGFATLRPAAELPAQLPAAVPIVRSPIVDPKVRTASIQDDVLRPAWPVITDPPVKK